MSIKVMSQVINVSKKLTTLNIADILTFGTLLFAWLAIISLLNNIFELSLLLIFVSFALDIFDGVVARCLDNSSDLGRFLDGQVDTLVHLLFTALFIYKYFHLTDIISILILFIFLAAGIFRLARFNLVGFVKKNEATHYPGLPVFVNNFLILILLFIFSFLSYPTFKLAVLLALGLISYLMVQKTPVPKPNVYLAILAVSVGLISSLWLLINHAI